MGDFVMFCLVLFCARQSLRIIMPISHKPKKAPPDLGEAFLLYCARQSLHIFMLRIFMLRILCH